MAFPLNLYVMAWTETDYLTLTATALLCHPSSWGPSPSLSHVTGRQSCIFTESGGTSATINLCQEPPSHPHVLSAGHSRDG